MASEIGKHNRFAVGIMSHGTAFLAFNAYCSWQMVASGHGANDLNKVAL